MDINIVESPSTKTYVVEGATLKCSLGTSTGKLSMPIGHGVFVHEKKQVNIGDFIPMINIPCFGNCLISSPPPPCVTCVSMVWMNGKEDVLIDGKNALLSTSMAVCIRGGIITIVDDGQE